MTPVPGSSTIEQVGYEPATQTLKIKFKSGSTYHFHDVPAEHHSKLITAQSLGKYFHAHIKTKFKGVKQDEKR